MENPKAGEPGTKSYPVPRHNSKRLGLHTFIGLYSILNEEECGAGAPRGSPIGNPSREIPA